MSILGQLDETTGGQFIKRSPYCLQIDHTEPIASIPNGQPQRAVVASVVEHRQFKQQGLSRDTQTAISVLSF